MDRDELLRARLSAARDDTAKLLDLIDKTIEARITAGSSQEENMRGLESSIDVAKWRVETLARYGAPRADSLATVGA